MAFVIDAVGPTYINAHGIQVPNVTAYHAAFIASACLIFLSTCIALAINDRDAAPTIQLPSQQSGQEDVSSQEAQFGV